MGITENEIRCGNWFHHKKTWSPLQPRDTPLFEFDFQWTSSCWSWMGECMLSLDDIEPIPLTKEVLLKCGFEPDIKDFYHHPQWYNLSIKARGMTYDLKCDFMHRIATNIDTLHHLQNLFTPITGTELTYTP